MMELRIISPSPEGFIKAIEWNHEEIKQEVATKVAYYKNLVYTDDQIREAKRDRATLNKFIEALESKRKEIKKQCMEPYEDFEKKMKEITAIVSEPIALIDGQVKEYEEKQRAEKRMAIESKFASAGFQTFVELEQIFDPKWLNASVSMKKIEEELNMQRNRIGNDIMTINNLPEFSFEALEHYKKTLDIAGAIQEGQRLADIQKRKLEHEAAQKAEQAKQEEAQKRQETKPEAGIPIPAGEECRQTEAETSGPQKEPEKQWVAFKVLLNVSDAQALKQFFESRNIQFEQI